MADFEEEQVPMDPVITLLHQRHAIASQYTSAEEKAEAKEAILKEVFEHNMRPYWQLVCDLFAWPYDEKRANEMDKINDEKIAAIDRRLQDAQDNLGDTEIRDALQAKTDHYARIGDMENCMKFSEECFKKTLATGPRLDLCFQRIRLGIAFGDNDVAARGIQEATRLMKGGDWERRNRLKVYEGLYHVFIRNFEKGSKLLIESLTTFSSTELLDYKQFVFIAVVTALPVLPRSELKTLIVDSPEVVSANIGSIDHLVRAIYQCKYKDVFPALNDVCQSMRRLVFLTTHVNYLFRELRVLAFNQFLDSYSSVTLSSMATAFGVPLNALDQMLCALISNERVACKIDRVSGSVTTYRGDNTNMQYHKIVKSGDMLLNRVQKLSRLVEM